MVFVFGIDIPLIELLFVYVILIIFALVIVLVEIAKLRRLLMLQRGASKQPLQKFSSPQDSGIDATLRSLEQNVGKTTLTMKDKSLKSEGLNDGIDPNLKSYIDGSIKRGTPIKSIKDNLISIGWPKEKIEEALRSA